MERPVHNRKLHAHAPSRANVKKLVFQLITRVLAYLSCFCLGAVWVSLAVPSFIPWGISIVLFLIGGVSFVLIGLQLAKLCSIWPFGNHSVQEEKSRSAPTTKDTVRPWLTIRDVQMAIESFNDLCDELVTAAEQEEEREEMEERASADNPPSAHANDVSRRLPKTFEERRRKKHLIVHRPKRLVPGHAYFSTGESTPVSDVRTLFDFSARPYSRIR